MIEASNLTSITNHRQAVTEFVGGQFISWLTDYIVYEVNHWGILVKLHDQKAEPQKLRKFLMQLFLVQQAMWSEKDSDPGFLKFALANLSESADPAAEPALSILESRFPEGFGENLKTLWLRLFRCLGLSDEEVARLEPKEVTRNYIAELSELYSNEEWQIGLGALVAFWTLLAPKFSAIYDLARQLPNFSEKDFEVLKLFANYQTHSLSFTHELLEKLSFDTDHKMLIWTGVERELALEKEFLEHTVKYLEN